VQQILVSIYSNIQFQNWIINKTSIVHVYQTIIILFNCFFICSGVFI